MAPSLIREPCISTGVSSSSSISSMFHISARIICTGSWESLPFCFLLGAIKTTLDLWIGPLPPRRKRGQKRATNTWIPRTTGCSSPRSSPMSWPHPDTTKFLLPRVAAKRKNFYCPPPISTSPFACIALPLPLISICTSPFACAFKPRAWLIHLGLWCIPERFPCRYSHKALVPLYPPFGS